MLPFINNPQIVYFDPPWGGKSYKSYKKLRLGIGGVSIENITIGLLNGDYGKEIPRLIIFKLPKNYDLKNFYSHVKIKDNVYLYLHKMKKINLLVVLNKVSGNKYISIE